MMRTTLFNIGRAIAESGVSAQHPGHNGGAARPRLDYLDALRAFVMSLGVVLHAGIVYSWWMSRSVNYLSGLFRMKLFVFLVGYFAALVVQRRGVAATRRERLIRFGVPVLIFVILFNPLANFLLYTNRVRPISFLEFLSTPPAWNRYGFAWTDAPLFMSWHGHLWFLIVALIYCLTISALVQLVHARPIRRGIDWLTAEGRSPSVATGALAIVMTVTFLGGRIMHLLTTQQVLGGGPFNFIAMSAWIYLGYMLLGLAAYRDARLFALLHRVVWWQIALALVMLVALVRAEPLVAARFGKAGSETLKFLGEGLFGFYLCVLLLALFRRIANRPSRVVRFLSEASYTVYLFHILLFAIAGYVLLGIGTERRVAYFIAMPVVYLACLTLHRWIVDRNVITRLLLNGKPLATKDPSVAASTANSSLQKR